MTETAFRGKQRRVLRGLGVSLKPVVFIGKASVSPGVLSELEQALEHHELIKVRLLDTVDGDRKEIAADLAERSGAELIQVLGRTVLLFRRNEANPTIELPA